MIAWLAVTWVAVAPSAEPPRSFDFEVAAFASHPERFSVCVAPHLSPWLEADLCTGLDRGVTSAVAHLLARRRWWRPMTRWGQGVGWGLGGGLGARWTRFCPLRACAQGGGPELLASAEVVWWLTPVLGLTVQLDFGLSASWTEVGAGVLELGYRFPARLLVGVAL